MFATTQKSTVTGSAPACPGDQASQASTFASRQEVLSSFVLFMMGLFFAALFLAWGYVSAFLVTIATYFVSTAYNRYLTNRPAALLHLDQPLP